MRDYVRPPDSAPWVDGDYYLHVNSVPLRIAAGSHQRALPCVVCYTPAGSQECFLLCLIAGILCPTDNSHLNGVGLFCHVRCLPESERQLAQAVTRLLARSGH